MPSSCLAVRIAQHNLDSWWCSQRRWEPQWNAHDCWVWQVIIRCRRIATTCSRPFWFPWLSSLIEISGLRAGMLRDVKRVCSSLAVSGCLASLISVSSKTNLSTRRLIASEICWICCATTDNTSREIRLNSSKQHHDPLEASPVRRAHEFLLNTEKISTVRQERAVTAPSCYVCSWSCNYMQLKIQIQLRQFCVNIWLELCLLISP